MIKYILGLIINLFNPAVSLFVKIDDKSSVDKKARIYAKARIFNSVIGAYSYVGRNTSIVHARIGKFCSIAGGSTIGLGTHTLDKLSTSSIFTEKNNGTTHSWVKNNIVNPYKKIIIGNDVWIGARAMIMGGVTIGDGAVIAAGAIVTKDVPPYAVVGGIPAKIIKYRFEKQIIDKLIEIKWWNLSEDILRDNIELFQKNILVEEELMYLSKK